MAFLNLKTPHFLNAEKGSKIAGSETFGEMRREMCGILKNENATLKSQYLCSLRGVLGDLWQMWRFCIGLYIA